MQRNTLFPPKQFVRLDFKTIKIATPSGYLTGEELSKSTVAFGRYVAIDEVMGTIIHWHLPKLTTADSLLINYIMHKLFVTRNLDANDAKIIRTNISVQWHLIPALLSIGTIAHSDPTWHGVPIWTFEQMPEHRALFLALAHCGAQYKHCIANAYHQYNPDHVITLLKIFGKDAIEHNYSEGGLIPIYAMTEFTANEKRIVEALLIAGVNINDRIDTKYNNTLLIYLIALEEESRTIELIELVDALHARHPTVSMFDFTLQDNEGKTALYLAAALGLTRVVEKLLELAKKRKINIGLNIPDNKGRTPAMVAAALGQQTVEQLIAADANLYATDAEGFDIASYMCASEKTVRSILEFISVHPDRGIYVPRRSYVYSAHKNGWPAVLVDSEGKEQLLVLSPKEPHYSLLQIACRLAPTSGHPDIALPVIRHQVKCVSKDAGPHHNVTILDCYMRQQAVRHKFIKNALLRLACVFGDVERMGRLVKDGANVDAPDHLDRTPLHYAVMRKELVVGFLQSQQHPRSLNECMQLHVTVVFMLLKIGADKEAKNSNEKTPVQLLERDAALAVNEITGQVARSILSGMGRVTVDQNLLQMRVS